MYAPSVRLLVVVVQSAQGRRRASRSARACRPAPSWALQRRSMDPAGRLIAITDLQPAARRLAEYDEHRARPHDAQHLGRRRGFPPKVRAGCGAGGHAARPFGRGGRWSCGGGRGACRSGRVRAGPSMHIAPPVTRVVPQRRIDAGRLRPRRRGCEAQHRAGHRQPSHQRPAPRVDRTIIPAAPESLIDARMPSPSSCGGGTGIVICKASATPPAGNGKGAAGRSFPAASRRSMVRSRYGPADGGDAT